jgi:5'-3' exonuclease
MVIDGHNVYVRGWKALQHSGADLTDSSGQPTGPLLLFVNQIARHVNEHHPTHLMVCFDHGPSTMRTEVDATYKQHRAGGVGAGPTVDLVTEFLDLAGIEHVATPGVEADDLIGYYWRRCCMWPMTIVSDDKDFLQLLCSSCKQVRLGRKDPIWTKERFMVEYGCEPEDWAAVLALAGDSSDGIVGVPGVGVKTAIKMLQKIRTGVPGPVFARLDWLTEYGSDRVQPHRDRVLNNYKMTNLRDSTFGIEAPIPQPFQPVLPGNEGWTALESFLEKHDMASILKRFREGSFWSFGKDEGP